MDRTREPRSYQLKSFLETAYVALVLKQVLTSLTCFKPPGPHLQELYCYSLIKAGPARHQEKKDGIVPSLAQALFTDEKHDVYLFFIA